MPLPFLPSLAKAGDLKRATAGQAFKRACFINLGNGLLPENFFPKESGSDYKASRYLETFAPVRNKMSVFSGLSHPGLSNHTEEHGILSGIARGNNTGAISIDQVMAAKLGRECRYESLSVWPDERPSGGGGPGISYNATGVVIPPTKGSQALYEKLFLDNISQKEKASHLASLQREKSILDEIKEDRDRLKSRANHADNQALDQYYQALRDAERKLARRAEWIDRPKPKGPGMPARPPGIMNLDSLGKILEEETELMRLAFLTDSTRVISLHHAISRSPFEINKKVSTIHRGFSHHGNEPEKLAALARIEQTIIKNAVADFLIKLNRPEGDGAPLLDSTMVCVTSNLGQPANHSGVNLPVIVAGAGFERDHGKHIAYDKDHNEPLCNLFLSMLHKLEIGQEEFGTSSGPLKGLV